MERQDELNEAWCKYMGKCSTEIIHALAFALRWCDEHPNWISVEDYSKDKLPPLIDKNNPYDESVQVSFVVVLDGIQYLNKGTFDYDTGVWHSLDMQCSFCKENVTHWMPLPAPPSGSSSENPNNCKKFDIPGYENVVIHEGNAKGGVMKGGKE